MRKWVLIRIKNHSTFTLYNIVKPCNTIFACLLICRTEIPLWVCSQISSIEMIQMLFSALRAGVPQGCLIIRDRNALPLGTAQILYTSNSLSLFFPNERLLRRSVLIKLLFWYKYRAFAHRYKNCCRCILGKTHDSFYRHICSICCEGVVKHAVLYP